jgi:hypothetical protein
MVDCPEDEWTKVATNIKTGALAIATPGRKVLQTYRNTGEAAPSDRSDAAPIESMYCKITHSDSIDVYLYPIDGDISVQVSV